MLRSCAARRSGDGSACRRGPELSAALLRGPEELRRRILNRLVKDVTYLKEDRNIEITLVLPHPDVPLRLAAPDDLAAPGGPESASRIDSARGGTRTHMVPKDRQGLSLSRLPDDFATRAASQDSHLAHLSVEIVTLSM